MIYIKEMKQKKKATSFRLSDKVVSLLSQLADDLNISKTAIVELAIREYAKRHLKN